MRQDRGVDAEHQGDALDRRVELDQDRGQPEGDDRGVGEGDPGGEGQEDALRTAAYLRSCRAHRPIGYSARPLA